MSRKDKRRSARPGKPTGHRLVKVLHDSYLAIGAQASCSYRHAYRILRDGIGAAREAATLTPCTLPLPVQ